MTRGQIPPKPPCGPRKSTHLDSGDHSANDDAVIARLEAEMVSRASEPNIVFIPRRPLPSYETMQLGSIGLALAVLAIVVSAVLVNTGVWP